MHPGTGRVCVPIDTNHLEEFNPEELLTITKLLAKIDGWEKLGVVKHEEDQEEVEERGGGYEDGGRWERGECECAGWWKNRAEAVHRLF